MGSTIATLPITSPTDPPVTSPRRPDRSQPHGCPLRQADAKDNALARCLLDRQDDYNGCERDIRMAKLKQKVSCCLRTMTGARQFCAIRSYLSTAARHGLSFFDALVMLTAGRPWIPDPA